MVGKHRNRILLIHWRFILTHGFVNTLRSIRIIPIPILASSSSSSSSLYCEGLISQYDHFSKLVNLIVSTIHVCSFYNISWWNVYLNGKKRNKTKKEKEKQADYHHYMKDTIIDTHWQRKCSSSFNSIQLIFNFLFWDQTKTEKMRYREKMIEIFFF